MPLIHSKSKKAFSKNVETEMKHGKPQPQALAIAYSIKRKKKASGGTVESGSKDMNMADGGAVSAKSEHRPMPESKYNDSKSVSRNSGDKPSHNDSWTDRSTVAQAQRPSLVRLSEPRMVESGVIRTKLRRDEHDLMDHAAPASPKEQPSRALDEEDATKMDGDPDMSKPHSAPKSYAKGGHVELEYGEGPEEDEDPSESPLDGLDDEMTPAVDEYMADHFAQGGHIGESEDNYADDGHEDSIAAAIMSRRNRLHDEVDSGAHDEDLATAYADGGEVDLSINHDEEPNNEDQMSFQALKKENYNSSNLDIDQPEDSNLMGDDREDEESDRHDRVGAIMSKMKRKQR